MVSLLNNGTMRLRNPGLVASDFTNGMSSEKSHQHETHQTSHILGFYSLQRSHRYIHNRSSKSIQSMQTGTSQVKHQTPGLEYSRWRTLRQTSRTVLSCPSLPLSPSLSPAGLIARYKRQQWQSSCPIEACRCCCAGRYIWYRPGGFWRTAPRCGTRSARSRRTLRIARSGIGAPKMHHVEVALAQAG